MEQSASGQQQSQSSELAGQSGSSASALYAPLALVGATSQAIDLTRLTGRKQQSAVAIRPSSKRPLTVCAQTSGSELVANLDSAPVKSLGELLGQPSVVVSQRDASSQPQSELSRADSLKSQRSRHSLVVAPSYSLDAAQTDQNQQRPVRAILRNRVDVASAKLRQSDEPSRIVRSVAYDSSTKRNSEGEF